MRQMAIMNQKGGSGKTTTSVNLAAALAEQGRRVLLLDLDPQASATLWLGLSGESHSADLLSAHLGQCHLLDFLYQTNTPNLQLIPSCFALFEVTQSLATHAHAETVLRRQIDSFPAHEWDYLICDCCPDVNLLSKGCLSAMREVLIPVEAHFLALHGLGNLLKTVEAIQAGVNPDLRVTGVLACRVDGRARHTGEVVNLLRDRFGDLMFETVIRENIRLAECPSFCQPITQYDTGSSGAEDYRSLAREVLAQEN